MPVVYFQETMAANATQDVSLAPYDRFGGGGGRVRVRAVAPNGATVGSIKITVMLGSDVLISSGPLSIETAAGIGVTSETPSISGIGAPGDPITVRIEETAGNTPLVQGVVDIQNA